MSIPPSVPRRSSDEATPQQYTPSDRTAACLSHQPKLPGVAGSLSCVYLNPVFPCVVPVLLANAQQTQAAFTSAEKSHVKSQAKYCLIQYPWWQSRARVPQSLRDANGLTPVNTKPTAMREWKNLNFFPTFLPKNYTAWLMQAMTQWEIVKLMAQRKQENTHSDSGFASVLTPACIHGHDSVQTEPADVERSADSDKLRAQDTTSQIVSCVNMKAIISQFPKTKFTIAKVHCKFRKLNYCSLQLQLAGYIEFRAYCFLLHVAVF